ncbi:PA14 domain-containing protein, partial [bacterium]|nr:PA14 domain-containing protein [bacterium]
FITLVFLVLFTGISEAKGKDDHEKHEKSCSYYDQKFCLEFFDNMDLDGKAKQIVESDLLSFNWALEEPEDKIKKDKFSVRAMGSFSFEEGTYVFTSYSDDGIRIFVNDEVVFEDWTNHGKKLGQVELELSAGTHDIKVEYFENTGDAVLDVSWEKMPDVPQLEACIVPSEKFCVDYFANKDLQGKAVFQEELTVLDKNWQRSSPDQIVPVDQFSARFKGNFQFAKKDYQFQVRADDGVRLYVDDLLVIDAWKNQSATSYTTNVAISSGTHQITVEYYENTGDTFLSASWSYARDVQINASADASRLNKVRVYAFSGTKYLGKYSTFDENGQAEIKDVPFGDVSYRVDYRGQHFTAANSSNDVNVSLAGFGFRDVSISAQNDQERLNKTRVYVYDENNKYQSVYGTFDEEGQISFFLPSKSYKYRVDYRGQWYTEANSSATVNVNLADFGFRNVEIDASANKDVLNKKRVYVFNEENKYQGVWKTFDENGKANFYLADKVYKYRVDYRGQWFTAA